MTDTRQVSDNILTKGTNKKLDKQTFIYSHTPVIGCGKNCSACSATCYALIMQRHETVKKFWRKNYELTKTRQFSKKFSDELKSRKAKLVRLMQAGDFYNQSVVNKFYTIIKNNPNVTFYGYTKNPQALKLNELPNCNIVHSYIQGKYLNFGSLDYCKLLNKKFGTYICNLDESKNERCGKDCTVCIDKCTSKNGVCFVQHGIYKNNLSYENKVIEHLKKLPDYKPIDNNQ